MTSNSKKIYVLIGVDCDHDRLRFNGKIANQQRMSWEGFEYFYPFFNKVRERISDQTGLTPKLVLNVRADEQVREMNGSYEYCFGLFEKKISNSFFRGDEIAWHNHQWRRQNSGWVQESEDKEWIEMNIRNSFEAIKSFDIFSLHAGWCFQNTFTMNLYSDLGIKVDYSALPGIVRRTGLCNKYDYGSVKNGIVYIPDREDYQKRGMTNEILEIPTTTTYGHFLNFLRMAENFQKSKRIDDFGRQNTFLGITVNPHLYKMFLKKVFAQEDLWYFVTFFHSDELLPDNLKDRQTIFLYKQKNIYHNLKSLIGMAGRKGYSIEFVNFKEFYEIAKKHI